MVDWASIDSKFSQCNNVLPWKILGRPDFIIFYYLRRLGCFLVWYICERLPIWPNNKKYRYIPRWLWRGYEITNPYSPPTLLVSCRMVPYISISLWIGNVNIFYGTIYIYSYASGEVEVDTLDGKVSAVEPIGIESNGIFLLGLFSSSSVTPSNFVIPTTGGSPFFTNSYWPKIIQISIWRSMESSHLLTRHFIRCQPECISCYLFVYISLQLKYNLADSNPGSPMIKGTLSFTLTNLSNS